MAPSKHNNHTNLYCLQGVLSVLGAPMLAADIRSCMHMLATEAGAQQVDVLELVRSLLMQASAALHIVFTE